MKKANTLIILLIGFFCCLINFTSAQSTIDKLEDLIFVNNNYHNIQEVKTTLNEIKNQNQIEYTEDLKRLKSKIKPHILKNNNGLSDYLFMYYEVEQLIIELNISNLAPKNKSRYLLDVIDENLRVGNNSYSEVKILNRFIVETSTKINLKLEANHDFTDYFYLLVSKNNQQRKTEEYAIIYLYKDGELKTLRTIRGTFGYTPDAEKIDELFFDSLDGSLKWEIEVRHLRKDKDYQYRGNIFSAYKASRPKRSEKLLEEKRMNSFQNNNKPKNQKGFLYPEERGEDLSPLSTEKLLAKFDIKQFEKIYAQINNAKNPKCIELRKAAKILGDREIAGTLNLTADQQRQVDRIITKYLENAMNKNYGEANIQIRYFWHLAIPSLIKNINHERGGVSELAIQSLNTYKTERSIDLIIDAAGKTKTRKEKLLFRNTLSQMQYYRTVNGLRNELEMSREETTRIYNEKIAPVVNKLEEEVAGMR